MRMLQLAYFAAALHTLPHMRPCVRTAILLLEQRLGGERRDRWRTALTNLIGMLANDVVEKQDYPCYQSPYISIVIGRSAMEPVAEREQQDLARPARGRPASHGSRSRSRTPEVITLLILASIAFVTTMVVLLIMLVLAPVASWPLRKQRLVIWCVAAQPLLCAPYPTSASR
jgi:hypothetical protein